MVRFQAPHQAGGRKIIVGIGRQRRTLTTPHGQHHSSCYCVDREPARNDRGSHAPNRSKSYSWPSFQPSFPLTNTQQANGDATTAFLFWGSHGGGEKNDAYNVRIRALRMLGSQMENVKQILVLNTSTFVIPIRLLECPCPPFPSC